MADIVWEYNEWYQTGWTTKEVEPGWLMTYNKHARVKVISC
jgi:hypothetical protein